MYVLEDNLRVPSGVSYMLENRQLSKRVFADAFRNLDIQPIDGYPARLQAMLAALSPRPGDVPVIAVLTPGVYNSAYFEHAFLAQQMGALLVEGGDLVVDEDDIVLRPNGRRAWSASTSSTGGSTTCSSTPSVSIPDSALGVAGTHAGLAGRATSPSPTLRVPGSPTTRSSTPTSPSSSATTWARTRSSPRLETFVCLDDAQRSHVLANLDEMVVKPANESGGYGLFIGRHATSMPRRTRSRAAVLADPRNYIGQPILQAVDRTHPVRRRASPPATSTSGRSSSPASGPT